MRGVFKIYFDEPESPKEGALFMTESPHEGACLRCMMNSNGELISPRV